MNFLVQAPWAKGNNQKIEAVAKLLGILHLGAPPPQTNLSVARAILNFILHLRA